METVDDTGNTFSLLRPGITTVTNHESYYYTLRHRRQLPRHSRQLTRHNRRLSRHMRQLACHRRQLPHHRNRPPRHSRRNRVTALDYRSHQLAAARLACQAHRCPL